MPHGVDVFNRDVAKNDGYLYTTNIGLSSQLATQRSTDLILGVADLAGRSVLDIGCGDAFYTLRFYEHGYARTMTAVDAAIKAVEVGKAKRDDPAIRFAVSDSHWLPFPDSSFDCCLLQSILHHDDAPVATLREAFRLAPRVLIHEPNGNNLGLKMIEKISPYHREHTEKSYSTWKMARYIEQAGGRVLHHQFAGFVPMFCPDGVARTMKAIEPVVERTPILNAIACSVYVLVAVRSLR